MYRDVYMYYVYMSFINITRNSFKVLEIRRRRACPASGVRGLPIGVRCLGDRCVCVYVYVYVCTYVCMYVCIYIYIYTSIDISLLLYVYVYTYM